MNIIDTSIKLTPTMRIIHCKKCDRTWVDKKIPNVCPHCGAKKSSMTGAKDDDLESFLEEYNEAMSSVYQGEESADEESSGEYESPSNDYSSSSEGVNQDTDTQDDYEGDSYEPIGYDPDELMENMTEDPKVSPFMQKELLTDAEKNVKETKWAIQRVGLPTDAFQMIMPEVRNNAGKLGRYIPDYTDLMLKMTVDSTLQHELRHPRKGKVYDITSVSRMLQELDINENYWESYYSVAGLM